MVYQRVAIYLVIILSSLFTFTSNAQSADDLWFNGFGPIKFGDLCRNKNADHEIHKHNGFIIKAHCFSYRGVKTGRITSISIYANNLTVDSAKKLINKHIRKKDKKTDLYWIVSSFANSGTISTTLWPNRYPSQTKRHLNVCVASSDNEIQIIQYTDRKTFKEHIRYGSLEIKIWANLLRCQTKVFVDKQIKEEKSKKLETELGTNEAKSLLESFN